MRVLTPDEKAEMNREIKYATRHMKRDGFYGRTVIASIKRKYGQTN